MKGGSVASDAVTGLVTEGAYNSLTKNFSHFMDDAKCGGGRTKKCSSKAKCAASGGKKKVVPPKPKRAPAKRGSAKKGGNPFSTVSNAVTRALQNALGTSPAHVSEGFNVFKSSPAPAGYEMANLRGANNAAAKTGGFVGKNLSQYVNSNVKYNVKNRKGGALDYSAIPNTADMKGFSNVRATPEAVDRLMASNSQSVSPSLDKTTAFGSVKDTAHYFSYSGSDKIVSPVTQGGKCNSCGRSKPKPKKSKTSKK